MEQVEAIEKVANAVMMLAQSVVPMDAGMGRDAAGGEIASLTEAVMGVTAGLLKIAEAIDGLAAAVVEHGDPTPARPDEL